MVKSLTVYTDKNSTSRYSNCFLNKGWYTTRRVIMAEQCCRTNNVVHYCFSNVVLHLDSRLFTVHLEQGKEILIEQAKLVRYCSTLLLNLVNNM